jgi:hypothetical protein
MHDLAVTDPVRSIRVASNLAERFKALVRAGSSVMGQGTDDLELRIGEAQQIYPEIWRHLDEARTALVAQGRDVAAFDELRRKELVTLGVTDIDSRTEINYAALMVGRLQYTQVKSATFNVTGYSRALAACKALMSAMPEVDFAALARAEDQEIANAGSLHSGKWIGIAKWLAIVAVLGGAGVAFYKIATRGGDPDENHAREQAIAHDQEMKQLREAVRLRRIKLDVAREDYAQSCAPAKRAELAALLREDSQPTEAKRIETEPCRPRKPPCGGGREDIQQRLTTQFDLDDANQEDWRWRCAGGRFGKLGLAYTLTARTKKGSVISLRGVAEPSGKTDLVAAALTPHEAAAIDTGDLDGDGIDEIVTIHELGVEVWRVRDGKLVDIPSPPVHAEQPHGHACTGTVEVVTDPATRMFERLVITVDEEARGKGCPPPGEHAFELRDDKLAEH